MHQNTHSVCELSPLSIGECTLRSAAILLLLITWLAPVHAEEAFDDFVEKHYIIGGQQVERNVYPWLVALTHNANAELVQRQFCGGSVIADQWVMTAAHCLFGGTGEPLTADEFKVAINATNLNDDNVPELDIANLFIHPSYVHNSQNPHSDIALIELAQPSGISPITLSTKPTEELIGLQAIVAGWGAIDNTDPLSPLFPVWLHSVDVPIVSNDVCNAPESYDDNIYPNQLCAGYIEGGRDSCVGDSGGPLVVTDDGIVQQVGVVSFGYGCALPNFYGIYTDVPYFIGWINQYVQVGEPEFEPELFEPKATAEIKPSAATTVDTGSSSFFVIFMLIAGIVIRRRLC